MVLVPGRSTRDEAGFSLIELLVVFCLATLLLALTFPSLAHYAHRANLETAARETGQLMQIARREAVKSNVTANVVFDFDANQVYAYADNNANNVEDAGEKELGRFPLPKQVYFWAAGDAAANGANALDTFGTGNTCTPTCPNGGFAAFLPTGAAAKTGAVRLGYRSTVTATGNFLEVRIAIAATGKLELRKYDPPPAPGTGIYILRDQGGRSWTWY